MEHLFQVLNVFTLVAWIVLLLAVRAKNPPLFRIPMIWAGALAVIYAYFLVTEFDLQDFGQMGSLWGVVHLFSFPKKALAGWVHYLAFDLVVGIWIARDAVSQKLPAGLVSLSLIATFFIGPVGALGYGLMRLASGRRR